MEGLQLLQFPLWNPDWVLYDEERVIFLPCSLTSQIFPVLTQLSVIDWVQWKILHPIRWCIHPDTKMACPSISSHIPDEWVVWSVPWRLLSLQIPSSRRHKGGGSIGLSHLCIRRRHYQIVWVRDWILLQSCWNAAANIWQPVSCHIGICSKAKLGDLTTVYNILHISV